MTAKLVPIVFATFSIMLAVLVLPRETFVGYRNRTIALWLCTLPLLTVFTDPLPALLISFVALIALAPIQPEKRVVFFILMVPAIPLYLNENLPFPGLNYLINLDYYKVAVLSLLVPLIAIPRSIDTPRQNWAAIDFCIIAYVLYTSAQIGMEHGLTGGMRFFLNQCLQVAAPYFAIRSITTRTEHIEDGLKAFLAASVILAAITLTSTFKQWDFYRFAQFDPIAAVADFRGGYLRIQATLTTHSLAYHLAAGAIFLEYFKNRLPLGLIHLWGLRVMLVAGMYFTGSRGAMTGFAVAFCLYVLLSIRSAVFRWALIIPASIFSVVAAYILMFGNASEYDATGNFNYRQQLLSTSLDYISEHLLFGDVSFLDSGRFDHLIQGQGIIDVTNMYLQIALSHGLLGTMLFFIPFLVTISRLAFLAMSLEGAGANGQNSAGLYALLCGLLIGWLALIATTSDVGLTLHLGMIFLAIGHGLAQQKSARSIRTPAFARA